MIRLPKAFGGPLKRPLHSVTYDAIMFKRFTFTSSSKRPDSALINYVWQNVFAKEDMIVDSEAMRVGNREGLGLMERIDQLANDSRAQKIIIGKLETDFIAQKILNDKLETDFRAQEILNDKLETDFRAQEILNDKLETDFIAQKILNDKLETDFRAQEILNDKLETDFRAQKILNDQQKRRRFKVRATEIEKSGHSQTEEGFLARSERNQVIHGGNIIEDLEVVEFMKAEPLQQRHDSLRAAFEAWYEVSLRYEHQILHAPELVVRTFNTLADTKSLWGWSNNPTAQDEAQKICRGIISKWLGYVDTAEGEYSADYISREFDKLVSIKPL